MLGDISQEKFSELIEQFKARRKPSVSEFEVQALSHLYSAHVTAAGLSQGEEVQAGPNPV